MSIIDSIARLFSHKISNEQRENLNAQISHFNVSLKSLEGHYVTFKESSAFIKNNDDLYSLVKHVRVSKKDSIYALVQSYISQCQSINSIIARYNQVYTLSESTRCNALLSDIDGKSLDDQQRAVVICDEDRCLVLAGAGSGKTLTIAGKVKYLCQDRRVDPEDILLIAFTRKSAEEMTTRISDRLGIPVKATTFHKLGLDIITEADGKRPEVSDDLEGFVSDYFENTIVHNSRMLRSLIEYFAYYLHIPADMQRFDSLGAAYDYEKSMDFETLRSKYDQAKYVQGMAEGRRAEKSTLKNEKVKSLEEVTIANFLFLNGIKYEYERLYPYEVDNTMYKAYRPDFYLPEYDIYIEHFGIDRNGNLPWLSPVEAKKYQDGMAWKREFHKKNGTALLETYSYYSSEGCLIEKLRNGLSEHGVSFREPDFKDLFDTIYGNASDRYLSEFTRLCSTFLNLFKSNGYTPDKMQQLKNRDAKYQSAFFVNRTEMFKSIVLPIIEAYNSHLAENGTVDFSEMIITATKRISDGYAVHKYKWIIIDEYQDISVARYRLVKAMLDQTGAKLLCVGDDWQSIYRFAGSDITLFTDFEKFFGKSAIMKIEKTYRNSQQLIDEASAFVMKNPTQLNKHLRSGKSLDYPLTFMCYTDNPYAVLKRTIDKIIHDSGSASSILLLGRTNYDFELLRESGLFKISMGKEIIYDASRNTPISFMSVHKAKGLEADNVILLNFQNDTLGFPNKIADDPILELVLTSGDEYLYAEERRLLYVALTRTKNRVFVLTDERWPSEFLSEFKPSTSVFILSTKGKDTYGSQIACPRCKTGHLLIRRNESNGRGFVGCSNYPQCDYAVPDTSIMTDTKYCPECGGFLVKRKGKYGYFYGCTNYPICKYTAEVENKNT